MGIFSAENGMHPGGLGLKPQGFDIMGCCHQVGFRRQFVGRMAPVGVGKGSQLAAVDKGLQPVLNIFKIIGTAPGRIADIVGQGGCFCRIGLQGADNIHPVQGMQMIEMDDVIMLELGTMEQVSDNTCVFGNFDANRIFDCPHRGQSMCVRSDAAGALHKMLRIPGITSLQDELDSPEHLP